MHDVMHIGEKITSTENQFIRPLPFSPLRFSVRNLRLCAVQVGRYCWYHTLSVSCIQFSAARLSCPYTACRKYVTATIDSLL